VSVHKRNGRWQVKWREGENQRSRTFDRKGDADTFDRELRRRAQLGPLLARELTRPLTLDEFVRTGFRTHAATLAPATRKQYAWALEHHLTELADEPLVAIDVPRLAMHQQYLLGHGRSVNTVRQALVQLSGILQVAVEHGHVAGNAARVMRKVAAEPRDEVRPLPPVEREALIAELEGRGRIIAVLGGHLGLRPLEIRQVTWESWTDDGLLIGRARTKRAAARTRIVTVPAATALELKRWRLESGRPAGDELIVGPMTKHAMAQWSLKQLAPVVKRVCGREDVTAHTLRHSHASALHYCDDHTLPRILKRLGHSAPVHFQHYAHMIDAAEGKPHHASLDAMITAARQELETRPVKWHASS
jgi:integrase